MTLEKFKETLSHANLSLKNFSDLIETPYSTVAKYGKSNPVPAFVRPFLHLYIENQKLERLKEEIKDIAKNL
jgi:hypothetical protein